MYHFVRALHRWIGLTGSLALVLIAGTGFLLATKDTFGWVKPPTRSGADFDSLSELVNLDYAASSAFALGIPELQAKEDIERIDYRPDKNVYKIVTHKGYHEVQVCGSSGKVLNVAMRVDQLTEDLHDFSFFADWLHLYGLPVVSLLLFLLGVTGVIIFFVPVTRRWKYRRSRAAKAA